MPTPSYSIPIYEVSEGKRWTRIDAMLAELWNAAGFMAQVREPILQFDFHEGRRWSRFNGQMAAIFMGLSLAVPAAVPQFLVSEGQRWTTINALFTQAYAAIGTGTPAPVFTSNPSVSPGSGMAGVTTFAANDGTASNAAAYTRRWLLDGNPIGTGVTVLPSSAGSLVLEVTATGAGGSTVYSTAPITVTVAPASLNQLNSAAFIWDMDPAAGFTSSRWTSQRGTALFDQATAALQPILEPAAWVGRDGALLPQVTFDGGSSNGDVMQASVETLCERWWTTIVAKRKAGAQNAVAGSKKLVTTSRASDRLAAQVAVQRQSIDGTNAAAYTIVGGNTGTLGGGFPQTDTAPGGGTILTQQIGHGQLGVASNGNSNYVNSAAGGTSTFAAGSLIGGSLAGSTDQFGGSFARILKLDSDLLPGLGEQQATRYFVEGILAWYYATQARLNAAHPYALRAPNFTDYSGKNEMMQGWGDSLANGWYASLSGQINSVARGLAVKNGGVGGLTSPSIRALFEANKTNGAGDVDQLTATQVRQKINMFGDIFYNNGSNGISFQQGLDDLAAMVGPCEVAQGVAAGQARLLVLDAWAGNGSSGNTPADTANDTIQGLYPNYFLNMRLALWALGAPNGPYPDADAYARRVVPAALRNNDIPHLNTLGYTEAAKILAATLLARKLVTAPYQ